MMRSGLVPLTLASDRRLADHVTGGSDRAFETLFQRHQPHVQEFCRQMLGTREEAEDAVQQTFLAAFRDLARGRRPREMRPWLLGIARRRCLALLTERRNHVVAGTREHSVGGPAGVVAARDELRGVLTDLASLPEDQRAALVLSELGGVSHRDIAEVLGCRRDKVKALVFQARESLATSRAARETPCAEIRRQLVTLEGGALRRRVLRRHLRDCAECRDFRTRLHGRERRIGLLLPFVPSLGLKRLVLGTLFGGGGGGAALGGGSAAVTALVAIAIPVGVVGAAVLPGEGSRHAHAQVGARATPATGATAAPPVIPATTRTTAGVIEPATGGIGARVDHRAGGGRTDGDHLRARTPRSGRHPCRDGRRGRGRRSGPARRTRSAGAIESGVRRAPGARAREPAGRGAGAGQPAR